MCITIQQAQKLLQESYAFKAFGFSLLITRLKRKYTSDSSQASLQFCVDEVNTYLSKNERIMEEDFAVISKI